MPPRQTTWSISEHTRAKHAILRSYLGAWFPILSRWQSRIVFIDGFAGPGEYEGGEIGSPLIALETAVNHSANLSGTEIVFVFIEENKLRKDHLNALVESRYGAGNSPRNFNIQVAHGEFDEVLTKTLDDLGDDSLAPTFAMIDPFGLKGIPLTTIARIANHERCEVLFSLMTKFMLRFLSTSGFEPHMDAVFGTDEWRDAQSLAPSEKAPFLRDLYTAQLKSIGFNYVPPGFELRDDRNIVEYYLVFGTNNLLGLEKMKDAMWSVDKTGNYRFSGYNASSLQLTLIDDAPNFEILNDQFVAQFQTSHEFTIDQVEEFVLAETHFRKAHVRANLLIPLEQDGALIVTSKRNRRMTYPAGTVMHLS